MHAVERESARERKMAVDILGLSASHGPTGPDYPPSADKPVGPSPVGQLTADKTVIVAHLSTIQQPTDYYSYNSFYPNTIFVINN